jgi:hypothetical protein
MLQHVLQRLSVGVVFYWFEGDEHMLKKFLFRWGTGAFACGCLLLGGGGESRAGVISGPTEVDKFSSSFDEYLFLMPAYTGLLDEVKVRTQGGDFPGSLSTVIRELNAVNGFYGTDTIDTEFQSMHLKGSVTQSSVPLFVGPPPVPVHFKVGQGNGFRPGLTRSPGQVAEIPNPPPPPFAPFPPPNGALDEFPAHSVFDLFIDVWVDINFDDFVDNGEVLRNYDQSLRMQNDFLTGFPPGGTGVDIYTTAGWVDIADPLLGEFGADVFTSRINFYVVNPDGTNSGLLAAQLDPTLLNQHIVPEPTSMAVFGGLMLLPFRRRLREAAGRAKSLFGSAS